MSTSRLEEFLASLPTRSTSELLTLLFVNDNDRALYQLTANDGAGYYDSVSKMRAAVVAIRAEIDHRLPARQPLTPASVGK